MQNKFFIAVIAATIAVSSFSSCENDHAEDTQKPLITIIEPHIHDTISLAGIESIPIIFSASDNEELHEVTVTLKNTVGTNVFNHSADVDATTYSFNQPVFLQGITGINTFTLTIDASDHHSNKERKTITFYVKP